MKTKLTFFKIIQKIRILLFEKLSDNKPNYKGVCLQPTLFLGKGNINVGSNTTFGYYPSPLFFSTYCHIEARHVDSNIFIGNDNYFNNNFSVIADHGKITIGNKCLVGCNVSIINSDFHPIRICDRHSDNYKCKDVIVGDNVFIGSNVSILKGVTIGDNAVIANGAVVYEDVEPNTIVRGNPAKFYKHIYE
jgi:maltose O-acetyltransferase